MDFLTLKILTKNPGMFMTDRRTLEIARNNKKTTRSLQFEKLTPVGKRHHLNRFTTTPSSSSSRQLGPIPC